MRLIKLVCILAVYFVSSNMSAALVREKRVIAGTIVEENTYPSIAIMTTRKKVWWWTSKYQSVLCSSVLIRNQVQDTDKAWLLTAAHCLGGKDTKISFPNYTELGLSFKDIPSVKEYKNPEYRSKDDDNRGIYDGDIGLIQITVPKNFTIAPMDIDFHRITDNDIRNGSYSTTTFAGYGHDINYKTKRLNEITVPIIPSYNCWGDDVEDYLWEHELCMGSFSNGGAGPISGDSGGPYFINRNGKDTIVGIHSAFTWGEYIENQKDLGPVRHHYHTFYTARMDGVKDFIISTAGLSQEQLIDWETDYHGVARLSGDRQGLCFSPNDGLGIFDTKKRECTCFPATASTQPLVFSQDSFEQHGIVFLVGHLFDHYRWENWSEDIPESALFDSMNSLGISELAGQGSGFSSEAGVPCRVLEASDDYVLGKLENQSCVFFLNNAVWTDSMFEVLVDNDYVVPTDGPTSSYVTTTPSLSATVAPQASTTAPQSSTTVTPSLSATVALLPSTTVTPPLPATTASHTETSATINATTLPIPEGSELTVVHHSGLSPVASAGVAILSTFVTVTAFGIVGVVCWYSCTGKSKSSSLNLEMSPMD